MDRRSALLLTGTVAATGFARALAAAPAPSFQPVVDLLGRADAVAEALGYGDSAIRPAYHQHILKLMALGYVEVFGTSVERPDWVPHNPFYYGWGAPNPDDIYRFAPIDAKGVYRLYGKRGDAPVATVTLRKGGAHLGKINGRTLFEIDLNAVAADSGGNYSVMLSATRPEGYDGAWVAMDPQTESLLYRSRTTHLGQTDPTCAIERIDSPASAAFPAAEQFSHRMQMLVNYVSAQNEFLLGYLNNVRKRGGGDGFIYDDQSGYGGLVRQKYLMHVFELAVDEALLVETDMPKRVHYWSVQVFDAFFGGIDNVYQQSAVNGEQVRIDADGRARFVVAARDPGVANWLNTGGWRRGGMLWRWNDADSYPLPSVKRVKFAQLARLLPRGTKRLDAAQRREQLREHGDYIRTRGR